MTIDWTAFYFANSLITRRVSAKNTLISVEGRVHERFLSRQRKTAVEKLWKIGRASSFVFSLRRPGNFSRYRSFLFTGANILRFEFVALKGFALLQMYVPFIVIGFQFVNESWVRYCISTRSVHLPKVRMYCGLFITQDLLQNVTSSSIHFLYIHLC